MTMGRSPAKWQTGRRANPLVDYNPHLGPALRDELVNAKRDGRWTEWMRGAERVKREWQPGA